MNLCIFSVIFRYALLVSGYSNWIFSNAFWISWSNRYCLKMFFLYLWISFRFTEILYEFLRYFLNISGCSMDFWVCFLDVEVCYLGMLSKENYQKQFFLDLKYSILNINHFKKFYKRVFFPVLDTTIQYGSPVGLTNSKKIKVL